MTDQRADFHNRVSKVDRAHSRLSRGYNTYVMDDGLIVIRPKRAGFRLPWKSMLWLLLSFFMFKAVLVYQHGAAGYLQRVDMLETGSVIDKGASWLFRIDPVTLWIVGQARGIIN